LRRICLFNDGVTKLKVDGKSVHLIIDGKRVRAKVTDQPGKIVIDSEEALNMKSLLGTGKKVELLLNGKPVTMNPL
jgi:hypothetical protein